MSTEEEYIAEYAALVEKLWENHAALRDELEKRAQDGIANDLGGMCPIVSPPDWGPVVLVENRWRTWLDAEIVKLNLAFKEEAKQLAERFGMRWGE